jgi:hypothetical protein
VTVRDVDEKSVTLQARMVIDRSVFGMTTTMLNMAPTSTDVDVTACFVRDNG